MTKDQQIKDATQGLALGLLAMEVKSVPSGRQALSFAFNRAWRNWSKNSQYPSLTKATFPGDLFLRGATKSSGRRAALAAWNLGRRAEPYLLAPQLDVKESLEISCDGPISPDDWIELARLFVNAFDSDEVSFV